MLLATRTFPNSHSHSTNFVLLQVCKAAEFAHTMKMERGDESIKETTPDMCSAMLHYALQLAQNGNFDQSECAFEKLTQTTEKTWGPQSYQLAQVFLEQAKARLVEGKHHEAQVGEVVMVWVYGAAADDADTAVICYLFT